MQQLCGLCLQRSQIMQIYDKLKKKYLIRNNLNDRNFIPLYITAYSDFSCYLWLWKPMVKSTFLYLKNLCNLSVTFMDE